MDNPHMSKRECGSCTACCEGWLSAEILEMSPGHPCRHCTSAGCAIYEKRPEDPCVRFNCAWLMDGDRFPEELRPDRAGVIVVVGRKWRDWDVILAVPVGESMPPESLEWLRLHARESRLPLIFDERIMKDGEYVGARARAFGSPAFADAVKYGIGSEDIFRM